MTIDAKQFAAGMSVLAATFGKLFEPVEADFYKATLDPFLTTEQFVTAIYATAATERFWPSPAVILDKVIPSHAKAADALKLEGARLFDVIRDQCGEHTPNGIRISADMVAQVAGPAAVMALRAIGGSNRYRGLTDDKEPWARKEFADAYATAVGVIAGRGDDPKTLAHVDPRVSLLVAALAPKLSLPSARSNRQLGNGGSSATRTGDSVRS
jgi:hypothetical protein